LGATEKDGAACRLWATSLTCLVQEDYLYDSVVSDISVHKLESWNVDENKVGENLSGNVLARSIHGSRVQTRLTSMDF
jgi:hypothetical protein